MLIGFLWAGIFFGFSSYFFESQFQYTTLQKLIAIGASMLGGIVAGGIVSTLQLKYDN